MFFTPVPAIAGKHSARLMTAQTVAPFGNIQGLLGHDPRSPWKSAPAEVRQVYEQVQRKTDKERKTRLRSFILDRMVQEEGNWVGGLPSIAIGIQNPQEFEPHDLKKPEAGVVQLDTSPTNLRIMIDGLGRISSAMDALDDPAVPSALKEKLRRLYIPVTLYMPHLGQKPLTVDELGQLFHDFNVLQATVSKGMAIDLDKSDIYVRLAERLSDQKVFIDHGGVDHRGGATARRGALVTKMTLVKVIRAAVEGPGSHVDHYTDVVNTPHLEWGNITEHEQRLTDYFSLIAK
jgi:DndB-like DNA-sulfur modification-associated protein